MFTYQSVSKCFNLFSHLVDSDLDNLKSSGNRRCVPVVQPSKAGNNITGPSKKKKKKGGEGIGYWVEKKKKEKNELFLPEAPTRHHM